MFDLPAGLDAAVRTLEVAGVADRCGVAPGDFFVSVPEGADAYVMKQVLHDWDDERATAIPRNLRKATSPDARQLILERVLPEVVTEAAAQTLPVDILMLVITGGREHTEQEFRSLLGTAGSELTRLTEPLPPFDYRVIEATPAPLS